MESDIDSGIDNGMDNGMENTWPILAAQWGAVRAGDRIVHFGEPEKERAAVTEGGIVADLGDFAVIRATGADHRAFLQAQLTSDIAGLAPNHVRPSTWLTAKGQVLCLMTLIATEDAVELLLPAAQLGAVHQRLSMFVLRAKVQLEATSAWNSRLGLAGPASDQAVAALLGGHILDEGQGGDLDGVWFYRLAGALSRYLVLGQGRAVGELAKTLRQKLTLGGRDAWHLASVEAGIPALDERTRERYIPQMLNLDQIGAVSFSKGCYPGQEIVARTQYLGRVKRRLYKAYIDDGPRPEVLSALTSAGEASAKQGEIVDVARSARGRWAALAVATVERSDAALEFTGPAGPQRLSLELIDYGGNAHPHCGV